MTGMTSSLLRGRWALPVLLTVAAVLVVAFVAGPRALLSARCVAACDPHALGAALAPALADFLRSGDGALPGALGQLVDLWSWWHATKVVVCAALVAITGLLGAALRHRRSAAGRRTARWWAVSEAVGLVAVVAAAGLLVLNVQATAAPLAALLPLLPEGAAGQGPGAAAAQVRALVVAGPGAAPSASLSVLVDEVARYHWTGACAAGALTAAAAAVLVRAVRRRALVLVVVAALAVVVFGLVCALSAASALQPLDALRGLVGPG